MDIELDSSRVMYVVGGLLGVATVLYFGAEIIVDMSPTLKSVVLLTAFAFFLAAGQHARSNSLGTVFYVFSAVSYLVFLWYTVSRFELSENRVFLLLGASSLLFVGLGYAFREKEWELDRRQARIAMAVLAVVAFAAVAGDAVGAQPAAETEFDDGFSTEDVGGPGDRVVVGETTLTNGFPLSRFAEVPRHGGCVYPGREYVTLSHVDEEGSVSGDVLMSGGSSRSLDVTAPASAFLDRETRELKDEFAAVDEVSVEVAEDCPEDVDGPRLVVVEGGLRGPVPLPR